MTWVVRRSLLAIGAALVAGCHVGPAVEKYEPAHSPVGARSTLTVGETTYYGELLAANDSALVFLQAYSHVDLVPYPAIRSGTFNDLSVSLDGGKAPSAEDERLLRMASRFPQGISPELERRLLAAYHQSAMIVLEK